MLLSSFVVAVVRDRDEEGGLSSGLSTYLVFDERSGGGGGASGGGGSGRQFGEALVNALAIVGGVIVATFTLVLCFYFQCYRALKAYLVFSITMLLGYTGFFVVLTAIMRYEITADWFTLAFVMFNFGIGGSVSIFGNKGVPRNMPQVYLVLVAVIMAWILTQLPEWTSWMLLACLALYDLCAVLTPCGPLNLLIQLAQRQRGVADSLQGLLYEADVGDRGAAAHRPGVDPPPRPARPAQSGPPEEQHSSQQDEIRGVTVAVPQRDAKEGAVDQERGEVADGDRTTGPYVEQFGRENPCFRETEATGDGHTGVVESRRQSHDSADSGGHESQSIKLGLGDFVFYSVLVSRAAMFDLATMAASFVAIILGLAGTLALLALMQRALPALPISIFLGIIFFFVTRFSIAPFIDTLLLEGIVV